MPVLTVALAPTGLTGMQHADGEIHAARAAEKFGIPRHVTDFRTLLELAGVPIPGWMHGRSMVPLLAGESASPWRDAFLYEYYEYPAEHCVRKNRGIRTDRWKLIHFWEQPEEWELYDLERDPYEMANAVDDGANAAAIARLREEIVNWQAQCLASSSYQT